MPFGGLHAFFGGIYEKGDGFIDAAWHSSHLDTDTNRRSVRQGAYGRHLDTRAKLDKVLRSSERM